MNEGGRGDWGAGQNRAGKWVVVDADFLSPFPILSPQSAHRSCPSGRVGAGLGRSSGLAQAYPRIREQRSKYLCRIQ